MKKITLLMLIAFMTITAHGQNKLLSSTYESYSSWSNTWTKSSGTNYEYDNKNNLTAETYLNWDSSNDTWQIRDKTTYTYNAANMVTEEIGQEWSTTNNKLENAYKTTYTYTAGKVTEFLNYDWENANWVLDGKLSITYNANNLLISYVYYDLSDTQLVPQQRFTATYNANNKILSSISESWDGSKWVNDTKTLYNYNANNKITSQKSADWDEFNSNWAANGNQTEYDWDATGNKTSETDYYKDSQGNINRYKDEYTYDTFNLMSSFAHPFKDKTGIDYFSEDYPYVNKVQVNNYYSYNNQTNSFQLSGRTTYNYNAAITLSTANIEKATTTISVYPNPTKAFLNISNPSEIPIDKIFVTDMTGRKVLEQNNSNPVNVQNLAKGIYVLEAYSGKEKMQSKFIKE